MINIQHALAKLRTHAYLVRLIISLNLLCALIILSVFTFSIYDLHTQNIQNQRSTYQHAGTILARALDDFAAQLENTAMQTDALSDQALASYLRGAEYSMNAITRLCI